MRDDLPSPSTGGGRQRYPTATKRSMVPWFSPMQLLRTAPEVIISGVVGRHVDHRLIEALATGTTPPYYDHTVLWKDTATGGTIEAADRRREIWIDYVADTGDGWNPTHAVASALARATLEVAAREGAKYVTKRGDLLVFGGDQVYPVARLKDYRERLLAPFESALDFTEEPHPHAFFLPGNHDWYDSLVAFSRLFCTKRWFAGWRTQQDRSYFAVRLPSGWWLLAPDVQLGSDIDAPQIEYFKMVATKMAIDDRVVLCCAQPFWIYSKKYARFDSELYDEGNLAFFEERVLCRPGCIKVFISGDLHHYRRHAAEDGTQKITAGGGGAFLSPTHGSNVDCIQEEDLDGTVRRRFRQAACWPDVVTSGKLCWGNLLFPIYNPLFGGLTGPLYAVLAGVGLGNAVEGKSVSRIYLEGAYALLAQPDVLIIFMAVLAGFVLFTDTHSRTYRWTAGVAHGLLHLVSALILGVVAIRLTEMNGFEVQAPWRPLAVGFLVLLAGWVWGSFLMGVYLLVSLNVFGRHSNEAFASVRIEDWKHFLRLHIDEAGALTIYPIGIRRVERKGVMGTDPELIENVPICGGGRGLPLGERRGDTLR